ncbi:iron-containing alcohol dehydrogenase family protein [Rhodococcus sp. 14C212]|uniref:iron-containing alcohol dehydrogenase family protein n=1 Tax=Rhodococcus sp. 14C212 TaxID=2711209 RepID=UPI0023F589B9|nr:iron-containing alcohol dehydrogenase family protein [Rhodococcus sp. 14C212]
MIGSAPGPAGQFRRAPLRVRWGPDSLESIGEALERSGRRRALVVTGPSLGARRDLWRLLDAAAAGRVTGIFAEVRRHSPLDAVLAAVEAISANRTDALIAVGGGSVMVTARAANILHAEDRPVRELATHRTSEGFVSPRLNAPKLPMYAVPTTPTTATSKAGSAVTQPGHRQRFALFDPKTRAHTIAVHPEFVATAPEELVLSASLDALCMSFEGLISVSANDWSDSALIHAARRLSALLQRQEGLSAGSTRTELAVAAIMAGDGTDTARGGLGAALAHTIGHDHNVANGVVEAILLPHVLDRVAAHHPGRLAAATSMGISRSERVPQALDSLFRQLGTPGRLRDIGVGKDALADLADAAMSDFAVSTAPGLPGGAEVLALLRAAW